jgi:hypothetical protein
MNLVMFWHETLLPAVIAIGVETAYSEVDFKQKKGRWWRGRCPFHDGRNYTSFCVDTQTLRWKCFSGCHPGHGDYLHYLNGGRRLQGRDFHETVRRAAEIAGVATDSNSYRNLTGGAGRGNTRRSAVQPDSKTGQVLRYPDLGEVSHVWRSCSPVGQDCRARKWLGHRLVAGPEYGLPEAGQSPQRAIDDVVRAVEDKDLVRVIPYGLPLPDWASYGFSWARTNYRLVFPLYDHFGRMRSLHARSLSIQPHSGPKAVTAKGTSTVGLVMADALGQQMLAGGALPEWWQGDTPFRVVVTEGEPDFLTWAVQPSDAMEYPPAVLGIIGGGTSGSWTPDLAARVPSGHKVVIRTHHDEAGQRYAACIHQSLRGRCSVSRSTQGGDQ